MQLKTAKDLETITKSTYLNSCSDVAGKNSLPPFGGFDPTIIRSAESQSVQPFVVFTFLNCQVFHT